jgi:uncharacterized surface protein with fasciclin (FAS1) repeats
MLSLIKHLMLTTLVGIGILAPHVALARNLELETELRSYGDLSDFYHAMVNTGVADELREGQTYTLLAPTNAAFSILNKQSYPCFYQPECRALAAAFIRAHIIEGHYPIKWLVREVHVQTEGRQYVHADEPFMNQYTINNSNVLSAGDVGGNIIYRLDGFVVPQNNLAVFSTASANQPNDTVITHTSTTYLTPVEDTEVNSQPIIISGVNASATTIQKTTITHIYDEGSGW